MRRFAGARNTKSEDSGEGSGPAAAAIARRHDLAHRRALTKINEMTVCGASAIEEQWCLLAASTPPLGRVTSSFDRAINVAIAGQPLSILAHSLGRAPGALVLTDEHVPRTRAGATVTLADSTVTIGSGVVLTVTIDFSAAAHYSSRVSVLTEGDAPAVTADALAAARTALEKVAHRDSFVVAADSIDDGFLPRAFAALRERAAALRHAVAERLHTVAADDWPVRAATARLIGLGAGLTPSGDDYLVGWLAVLTQSARGCALAAVIEAAILDADPTATTEVSRAYLHAAADHRFHEDLAAAARSCLRGDVAALRAAFGRVATVGATSGTDSLAGVVDALDALAA